MTAAGPARTARAETTPPAATAEATAPTTEVVGPRAAVSIGEIARTWYLRPQDLPYGVHTGGLEATVGYRPERDSGTFSYATHAVVVAVDPEIGDVEILDYVIVEDGGKLINPMQLLTGKSPKD